jgi:hypothetical protein
MASPRQAVRNYEDAGIIPPAHRSRTEYRDYTATHAAGLAAYLALVPAFGYSTRRRIMHAVTGGQLDEALESATRVSWTTCSPAAPTPPSASASPATSGRRRQRPKGRTT